MTTYFYWWKCFQGQTLANKKTEKTVNFVQEGPTGNIFCKSLKIVKENKIKITKNFIGEIFAENKFCFKVKC